VFTARVLSLLVLLCSSFLAVISQPAHPPHITCDFKDTVGLQGGPRPILSDCHAGIDMIPKGEFLVEGRDRDDPKPINLHVVRPLTAEDQPRTFLMPAMFRSGTWLVTVHSDDGHSPPVVPAQPSFLAASWMYSMVWPDVRHETLLIMKTCFEHNSDPNNRFGEAYAHTEMPHGKDALLANFSLDDDGPKYSPLL